MLVMPTPGDTGTFFLAHILGDQVNEVFPKDELFDALMEAGLEKAADEVLKIDDRFSVLEWFKNSYHLYMNEYIENTTVTDKERKEKGKNAKTEAYKKYGEDANARWMDIRKRWEAIESIFKQIGLKNFIT